MELDRDFNEFLACLVAHEVRFLVVGGYAVAVHGHPRYTGDLDIWVWTSSENADGVLSALADFGFASVGLSPADFTEPDRVVQLGYPPVRIDLLTSIDGVDFEGCFARRLEVVVGGLSVPFIALDDLRRNKAASGRPQDRADLAALEE
ncbi:MAG: nucleotidyltransferase [Frankiaceae bacterium]|nr:nucleotidyltransferase [Frankiaceae bacterium]